MKSAVELINILRKEKELYEELSRLEENKSKAIMKRNGGSLDDISRREDLLLKELSFLEEKRVKSIKICVQMKGLDTFHADITLRELAAFIGGETAEMLLANGYALKNAALKVKRVKELNEQLMQDNLNFFQTVFSGLKNAVNLNTGYSPNGKEDVMAVGSLLFNKTA